MQKRIKIRSINLIFQYMDYLSYAICCPVNFTGILEYVFATAAKKLFLFFHPFFLISI